jgi:DNA-binding transcriptional regulator GbsR (MarR family)
MEKVISQLEETTLIYKKINEPKDKTELKRLEETLFQIVNEMKEKTPSENIEIYNSILKETLEEIRKVKYSYIENHIIESKEGELNTLAATLNKVIFATEDISNYILDIKSI